MKRNKSRPTKVPSNDAVTKRPDDLFPIVGVGASAGGLEAFSQLLASLPDDTGMAYVLVQHLDPHHETRLSDLLSKVSLLPIQEAVQDVIVKPNHVYIIPPNMSMTIAQGVLKLAPRQDAVSPFLPIDHFFRSLAEDQQERAIAVVLSGTGTDGTQGLEEIKTAGGITFAQDQTAKFPGMPQSAIQTGCVDFILPPHKIGQELTRISHHPYMVSAHTEDGQSADEKEHYKQVLALLRSVAGVDFTAYRDTTIKRRIMRRMALHTKEGLADYIQLLENDRSEVEALYHDLLINVTSFFREPETFEALKASVFPELLRAKESNPLIRIWVPGCSTGQEAYSLAMVLLEFMSDKAVHPTIQIFATDLSEAGALRKAREGLYSDAIESEVPPERLRRFFTKENGKYRINKSIREMCVFAKHNVAADPPFSRMDLISCRNLLIYLALPLQRRVIPTFHYALNPGGFLLLGAAETIGVFTDLFSAVDQVLRIYGKKAATVREYPHFTANGFSSETTKNIQSSPPAATPMDWQREADRIVLTKYAPTGVLVNDNLDILQFRGKTGAYLESPPGEPSHNLLRMAADGLFSALRDTVSECREKNTPIYRQGVRIRRNEHIREIEIRVLPVKLPGFKERCFLILFEENTHQVDPSSSAARPVPESDDAVQLRQELASMQEYVQSVIEQKDTINEELRATNEESLSSNEELQSTNEELETAKEELQSVNEELTTVNEQLNHRNKELTQLNDKLHEAHDYAKAIVETVREPLIVLDADMRVQMANPAFYQTFGTTPEKTENRLLYELGNRQWDIPELQRMLESILLRQAILTNFEVIHTFESIGSKTMLLNARTVIRHNSEAPLVLLAIEDISERKWLEEELQKTNQKLSEADHRKDEFLATLAHELRNPLAPLCDALELLKSPGINTEVALQAHDIMEHQLTQMVRLVDDLLDVSRITSGKIELRKERVELAEIIKSAVATSRPLIDAAGHILTVALPETSLWLEADPVRMAQVLSNLLNNAAKYTQRNGRIQLSAERKENTVFVYIEDNGIGLSADVLLRVFDMFSQVDSSIERAQGGMGIGLALVKNLVELHGGSVTAASAGAGQGSKFTVSLPLAAVPKNADRMLSKKDKQFPVKDTNSKRVLVVEDNQNAAKTMGWMLELMFGQEVQLAHDGVSAIALAKSFLPDLVLLDIGLPGMSGYEICHALRQEPTLKNMRIAALTGWGQEEDHQRTKKAGFDHHLVKPVPVNILREVLNSLEPQKKMHLEATG